MNLLLNRRKIKTAVEIAINKISNKSLYYIIEGRNWSVDHDGYSITAGLEYFSSRVTPTYRGITDSIVHYGSINTFIADGQLQFPHKSNKVVVTWFHVSRGDKRTELISRAAKHVDLWHTSCNITRDTLVKLGVPREKTVVIPLGVSLNVFSMPTPHQKQSIRSKLQIPSEKLVIGSFQKDGNGWGEGLEPKLIKGPDVFCDVIEKLRREFELFVLLTGPARGYVKKRLEEADIPYLHHFFDNSDDVAEYYKALDLYIVTSRQEGGPKSILESLATGVPLVSTRVGMAPDMITDGENGFLCSIDNVDEIARKAAIALDKGAEVKKAIGNGLTLVRDYDWSCIARQYENNLYRRFLA